MTALFNSLFLVVTMATGIVDHYSVEVQALSNSQLEHALLSPGLIVTVGAHGTVAAHCVCSVPLRADEIPATVIRALLATEDRAFFQHGGIDPWAIARAAYASLRGRSEGGSTLTQQLVKNEITGTERSLERKLVEARLALRVERLFTKSEILRLYLGRANFGRAAGREIWGLRNAALAYWGKPPEDLDVFEAALLVALLKAPTTYSPFRHP